MHGKMYKKTRRTKKVNNKINSIPILVYKIRTYVNYDLCKMPCKNKAKQ